MGRGWVTNDDWTGKGNEWAREETWVANDDWGLGRAMNGLGRS